MNFILLISALAPAAFAASSLDIHDATEFIIFSNMVASGKYFLGETVRLVNDIEFDDRLSSMFNPIGTDYNNFRGDFDGQGHVIRGLSITADRRNVGLFGYAEKGVVIRNVVLDSTCSFMTNYSMSISKAYIGGIIGYCFDGTRKCLIENTVNLGTVGFSGNLNNYLYMGSIVGECEARAYGCTIRNNANYGLLYHTSTSRCTEMGGIIGYCYVPSDVANVHCKLINNLNAGKIKHEGETTLTLEVGGIVGMLYGDIDNSVFAGSIETNQNKNFYGGLIGYLDERSVISHSYWTAESGLRVYDLKYGFPVIKECEKFDKNFVLENQVTVGNYTGNSLLSALNAYTDYWKLYDYSKWLLNHDNVNVTFNVNKKDTFMVTDPVIMLPNILDYEDVWFNGWYKDPSLLTPLQSYEISEDATLYSSFAKSELKYTIKFDTRGGSPVLPIVKKYHSFVKLPETGFSRRDYTFIRWENDYNDTMPWNFTMPSHDMTLHAVWLPTYIRSPEMLIELSDKVRNWESYEGLTVYLGADLDFANTSARFQPIGSERNWFNGTFDGQGRRISNLHVKSSAWYFGVFGYSGNGITIRNVVLDGSCSFECNANRTLLNNRYISGIIGACVSNTIPCIIENSISYATLMFTGNLTGTIFKYFYMASIIADCRGNCLIRNCANYGTLIHTGVAGGARIGGILGYCNGMRSKCVIKNNVNYGALVHNGNSTWVDVSGISPYAWASSVENCVNAGTIIINDCNFTDKRLASIIGSSFGATEINLCFWDESIDLEPIHTKSDQTNISGLSSFDSNFDLTENATIGNHTAFTLLDALNTYTSSEGLPTWVLNRDSHSIRFQVNARSLVTLDSKIILLPNLANEGKKAWFDGWYEDSKYTVPLKAVEMTRDTTLYGLWVNTIGEDSSSYGSSSSSSSFGLENVPSILSLLLSVFIH